MRALDSHRANPQQQRDGADHAEAAGCQRPARAECGHADARYYRAAHLAGVHRHPAERAGLLHLRRRHDPGQQCLRRRVEQRHAGPGQRLQQDHLPQPRLAGQHQQPEGSLADRNHDVRGDDDPLRRHPVRDHAADQGENQRRRDLRGQHVGELGGRSGRVQHRERHADEREPERRGRQQSLSEQQPEIAKSEHGKAAHERTREHDLHPICLELPRAGMPVSGPRRAPMLARQAPAQQRVLAGCGRPPTRIRLRRG